MRKLAVSNSEASTIHGFVGKFSVAITAALVAASPVVVAVVVEAGNAVCVLANVVNVSAGGGWPGSTIASAEADVVLQLWLFGI